MSVHSIREREEFWHALSILSILPTCISIWPTNIMNFTVCVCVCVCDVIVMLTLCGDANCRMRLPRQPQHLAYASSLVQSVNQGIISPVRLPRQPQRANQFAQFVGCMRGISFACSDPGLTALTGMFICSASPEYLHKCLDRMSVECLCLVCVWL